MYNVEAMDIATAHQKVCKLVIEEGEYVETEDKQPTWELPEPVAILVREPMAGNMRHPMNSLSAKAQIEYLPMVLEAGNVNGHAYTYGDRLHAYPRAIIDGVEMSYDQMEAIAFKIAAAPTTRRAIAHTWVMDYDADHKTPPCLQTLQFVYRKELNVVGYFRSNDMADAWGNNAFGLAHLLERTAGRLGVPMGYLQTISTCAHIYDGQMKQAKMIAYG